MAIHYSGEDQQLAAHAGLSLRPIEDLGLGGLVKEIFGAELLRREKLRPGIAYDSRFKSLVEKRLDELYTCLDHRERDYSDKSPMRIGS